MPGRQRSIIPALPLPRRTLPWILFALGAASIAYGSYAGDLMGMTIGVVAVGGAVLSWAVEWILGNAPRPGDDGDGPES